MNPTTLAVSGLGMANQIVGASVHEAATEASTFSIDTFIFVSNIGVFAVTAWLAWVTFLSVREARRGAQAQAETDDKQQERLVDALDAALKREQEAAHEPPAEPAE